MNSLTRVVRRFAAAVASGLVVAAVGLFAQTPAKTPTDAYLNYRAAILKVRSMDQLKPHLAQSAIKMMDSAPADQRAVMLDFIKEMRYGDYERKSHQGKRYRRLGHARGHWHRRRRQARPRRPRSTLSARRACGNLRKKAGALGSPNGRPGNATTAPAAPTPEGGRPHE